MTKKELENRAFTYRTMMAWPYATEEEQRRWERLAKQLELLAAAL